MTLKTFYLLVSIMVTFTAAKTIGKGLSLPPPSASVSPPPNAGESSSINVNLTSDFLVTSLGITGAANANQQISEGVIGNNENPATIVSSSSNSASLQISGTAEELATVEVPEDNVSTLNAVNTEVIVAGSENLEAALHGVNASVGYVGQSSVPLGGGITESNAETQVEVIHAVKK